MTQTLKLTHVKTYTWTRKIKFFVIYSSNRRPEDGGWKTPKHVAFITDINNKELSCVRVNVV
jgi:hypothetical protein